MQMKCVFWDFNPRSQGGATVKKMRESLQIKISIHAPKGERHLHPGSSELPNYFNPRSQGGATHASSHADAYLGFQSTLPRGSDRFANPP